MFTDCETEMAQAAPVAIQDDIRRAFSVKTDRVFHRKNDQVYAIVGVNRELGVVSDVWFDRFDSAEEFRRVLVHVLSHIRDSGCNYWLADLRFLTADFADSEHWLTTVFMPEAFREGLQREAVVLPDAAVQVEGEDAYGTASRALSDIADGRVCGFTDIALAKKWLLEGTAPGRR